MGRRRALLIGVEEYQHLSKVDFARADVTALKQRLTGVCSYLPEDVEVLTDDPSAGYSATHDRVIANLRRIKNACEPDDSFLLFFAGHGMERNGKTYLAAQNTNAEDEFLLEITSIPLTLVRDLIGSMPGTQKIILTDACRRSPERDRADRPNVMARGLEQGFRDIAVSAAVGGSSGAVGVMLACAEGQSAYPWPEKGHGAFCYYLLDALGERSADDNGNILFPRVQEHVQRGLEQWSRERPGQRQTPCAESRGQVVIGRLNDSARRRRVQVTVEPPTSTVRLQAEFSGMLLIDGEEHGMIPEAGKVTLSSLEPGDHRIVLEGDTVRFEWSGKLIPGRTLDLLARQSVREAPLVQAEQTPRAPVIPSPQPAPTPPKATKAVLFRGRVLWFAILALLALDLWQAVSSGKRDQLSAVAILNPALLMACLILSSPEYRAKAVSVPLVIAPFGVIAVGTLAAASNTGESKFTIAAAAVELLLLLATFLIRRSWNLPAEDSPSSPQSLLHGRIGKFLDGVGLVMAVAAAIMAVGNVVGARALHGYLFLSSTFPALFMFLLLLASPRENVRAVTAPVAVMLMGWTVTTVETPHSSAARIVVILIQAVLLVQAVKYRRGERPAYLVRFLARFEPS